MKRSKPINSSAKAKRQTVAELRALQRLLARAVMRPLTAAQRMRPEWSDGQPTKKVAAGFIKPNKRLTAFERLEIYNRQYWFRVIECFYDDYPGVQSVLGEKRFHNLAIAYLANHPSISFTLRNLGRHLADFIARESKWVGADHPLAMEMAQLEWAHIEAFDNEARPPVTAEDLAACDANKLRLKLQPHIVLLELNWLLDNHLISLRENSRLRGEASNAMEAAIAPAPIRSVKLPKPQKIQLAVHRYNNVVYYKRLSPDQFALLTALQKGKTLARALAAVPPAEAGQVGRWFKDWAVLGWFFLRK